MVFENPEFRILTISVEFELVGEIQGLYFIKLCKEECEKLGLCGWVKITSRGAIVGKIQGPKFKIQQMIFWLRSKGPPGCRIDNCSLYNYKYLPRPEYRGLSLRF